jgi:hypothetical protein
MIHGGQGWHDKNTTDLVGREPSACVFLAQASGGARCRQGTEAAANPGGPVGGGMRALGEAWVERGGQAGKMGCKDR